MNILLINHYAGSPEMGMEYRPYYLAREWQQNGHQVRIIASSFSHLRSKQPVTDKRFSSQLIDNIHYTWIRTQTYTGNSQRRVVNMLSFITGLFAFKKWLPEDFRPDVVIASSTYPLDIFPAYKIAKKYKAKLIFEVHDLWPLSPMELGGYSKHHPFILLLQYAENFAYKRCNQVVSMLPKAIDHMAMHGLDPKKFQYLPNGVNPNEWQRFLAPEHEYINLIKGLKIKNQFLVCYAGSIGIANALHTFVKSAKNLIDKQITLIIIGNGPEKINLITLSHELKLNNLVFFEAVPKKNIPEILDQMDVLYIGWQRSPLYRFGISPNKLLDYMMAAKPIIHAVEAGNDLVREADCGISIEPANPDAIANAILRIKAMPQFNRDQLGRNGRDYVIENHDYRKLAQKFIEICDK